jgi:hypothetical protein
MPTSAYESSPFDVMKPEGCCRDEEGGMFISMSRSEVLRADERYGRSHPSRAPDLFLAAIVPTTCVDAPHSGAELTRVRLGWLAEGVNVDDATSLLAGESRAPHRQGDDDSLRVAFIAISPSIAWICRDRILRRRARGVPTPDLDARKRSGSDRPPAPAAARARAPAADVSVEDDLGRTASRGAQSREAVT